MGLLTIVIIEVKVMAVVIDGVWPPVSWKQQKWTKLPPSMETSPTAIVAMTLVVGGYKSSVSRGKTIGWSASSEEAHRCRKIPRKATTTVETDKENGPISSYCSCIGARAGPGLILCCEAISVVPV